MCLPSVLLNICSRTVTESSYGVSHQYRDLLNRIARFGFGHDTDPNSRSRWPCIVLPCLSLSQVSISRLAGRGMTVNSKFSLHFTEWSVGFDRWMCTGHMAVNASSRVEELLDVICWRSLNVRLRYRCRSWNCNRISQFRSPALLMASVSLCKLIDVFRIGPSVVIVMAMPLQV